MVNTESKEETKPNRTVASATPREVGYIGPLVREKYQKATHNCYLEKLILENRR